VGAHGHGDRLPVGGEDNHVIVGGVLPPPGATMFERKRYLETHGDELRRWLLLEPRGKPTLCVNLVTPPTRPDCDAGVIIMEASAPSPSSSRRACCRCASP
jgi:proline racemase